MAKVFSMAKLSKSRRRSKKQRPIFSQPAKQDCMEDYDNTEKVNVEDDHEEEEDPESDQQSIESQHEEGPYSVGPDRDGSISMWLTDPQVLHCCVCSETLTIPVFQCENGHIVCSFCRTKVANKCHFCSCSTDYNRCRAIEKILESVRISCQNTKYGCKETVSYCKKNDHEKTCMLSPCSCPFPGCNFISSSKQLYLHFSSQHKDYAIRFAYNDIFSVAMKIDQKFLVLQEEKDGILFILNNQIECVLGNVLSLSCIGPSPFGGFFYFLLARTEGNSLRLQSFTKSIPARVYNPPYSTGFLLIPSEFFGSYGQLILTLCIWKEGMCPPRFSKKEY